MGYDIFESVSQRKYGEDAPQISRMEEVADFLYRSCAKNEAKSSDGSTYGGNLYSEQGFIEKYAEEHNCWYSIGDVFGLGTPGPSGSENEAIRPIEMNGLFVIVSQPFRCTSPSACCRCCLQSRSLGRCRRWHCSRGRRHGRSSLGALCP